MLIIFVGVSVGMLGTWVWVASSFFNSSMSPPACPVNEYGCAAETMDEVHLVIASISKLAIPGWKGPGIAIASTT